MTGTPFPIERGHVLAFARALGEEGDAVPPTFPIAFAQFDPDWPLRMTPGRPWNGSGAEPGVSSGGPGGLHAEQEFEYFRPIRAGETLTARRREGRTWQKEGGRGVLNFTERHVDFFDAAEKPVARSTTVSVTVTPAAPREGR
ncbi:FAS1-like dehydratase domain-containing protein [Sphaerisporangium aureirubrum]|uniref:MaoC family dehydratase N-terminal domain-containing protein n=1 Tax=Sphaerisporangium aureirubrum TaxID=1544736 RepID=A0ABW1NWQ6_9ACTN